MLYNLAVSVAARFMLPPRPPRGRHATGNVKAVPASWSPLTDGTRYRIRAAALRPRKELAA